MKSKTFAVLSMLSVLSVNAQDLTKAVIRRDGSTPTNRNGA